MTDITTEAGKRLLNLLARQRNATADQHWRNGIAYAEECIEKSLPRIEAEARAEAFLAGRRSVESDGTRDAWQAEDRARLAEAVRRTFDPYDGPWQQDQREGWEDCRAAVLAILEK